MKKAKERRLLFRWIGWFFFTLSILLFLIQLAFLKYLPNLSHIYGATAALQMTSYSFLFASYVTQASIIAFSAAALTLIITALIPRRWLSFSIAISLSGLLVILQTIDFLVYSIYHSHEIVIGLKIIRMNALNQVIPLSIKEIALLTGIIAVVVLTQCLIGWLIWRRVKKESSGNSSIWITTVILVCFCFSYGLMASAVSIPKRYQLNDVLSLMLLKTSRLVPYYSDVYEFILPTQHRYERTIETTSGPLTYQTAQPIFPMLYPKEPLHCKIKQPRPNILFLVIDTWRFDAMNATVTPNIYRFSKKTLQFRDHWSGGNCTQAGIFSLFYAIPENYWDAVKDDKLGPVFIRILQKNHYQFGIYASATLTFPAFNKTVFLDIKNLRIKTPGKTTVDRDKEITKEFEQFLKSRDKHRPFFGFLFYDAAHNYCGGGPKALQSPFKPVVKNCARFSLGRNSNPTPYINRYHNAIHFIDAEIGKVLVDLKKKGLYKNTIIIITSDHGEQFNDEKLGYWSHNSTYSTYQLHVPMLIYWPRKLPRIISYFSTHYEVVPTLFKWALYCNASYKSYSTGHTLFRPDRSNYFIGGNYTSYSIVTKKRDTTFYPNGDYAIRTLTGKPIPYARINAKIVRKANEDLIWFFR